MPEQAYPADWPTCACGCGESVPAVTYTHKKRGLVKGKPRKFVQGHNRLKPDYTVDPDTGCWVWQKGEIPGGYGRIERKGVGTRRAHVFYYEQFIGKVAADHEIHHRCENRLCVNPDHLRALTKHQHMLLHKGTKTFGVIWAKAKGCYWAKISRGGEEVHVGFFDTEAEAAQAIEDAGGYSDRPDIQAAIKKAREAEGGGS